MRYSTLMRKVEEGTATVDKWSNLGDVAIITLFGKGGESKRQMVEVTHQPYYAPAECQRAELKAEPNGDVLWA